MQFIMSCIVVPHQTLMFSATMPQALDHLIHQFLHDPVRIELNKQDVAPSSLTHEFIHVPRAHDRDRILFDFLLDKSKYRQVLIFCNSRFKGDHLYSRIRRELPSSDYLHGGMDQDKRTRIFGKFKRGTLPILIATDVAGRGLDFSNVSHVINFDFPRDTVTYTHRTGRAGRMGRTGIALSFVTDRDVSTCYQVIEENRIDPVWHTEAPSRSRGRSSSGRRHPRRKTSRR
jgi:ATP-dependent RNA helicase DeaD